MKGNSRKHLRTLTLWVATTTLMSASPVLAASQLFDTWTGYPTGYYGSGRFPYAARAADLDGDLAPEVLVAQWPWNAGISITWNEGDGAFGPALHLSSALPSLDVAAGDFDQNGMPDVVVSNTGVNWEGNSVTLYRNLGGRTFASPLVFSVGAAANLGPVGLAVDDFNNDENPDLAVARYGYLGQGNTVALLLGDGSGNLGPPAVYPAGDGPYKLAAGRLNEDDLPDLAVANEDQKLTILINNGFGGFMPPVTYDVLQQYGGDIYPTVALADVDNDQDLDVLYSSTRTLAGSETGAIALFRNQGDGSLTGPEVIPLAQYTAGPVDLATGDFDGNGWTDVVGAHFNGRSSDGWELALNDGAGGFLAAELHPAGQQTVAVLADDADRDTDTDILTVDQFSMEVTVHENAGDGSFSAAPTYSVEPISIDLDAADIDGDSDLDIVTSGGTTAGTQPSVLINQGDGTFAPHVTYPLAGGLAYARFRDLNGDERPDLLAASASPPYYFHVAMNLGDGTFGPYTSWPIPSCGSGHLEAVDLDHDGDRDVCFAEYLACPGDPESGFRVYISYNRGDGTFESPAHVLVDQNPYDIRAADLNGDQNMDLAVANWGVFGGNNKVSILLGTAIGTFQLVTTYEVGQGPRNLVIADLNGDRIPDIATGNTGSGTTGIETMSVLRGRGDGSFFPAVTYDGAYSPDLLGASGITAGDPDQDGDLDVMVSNAGSSDICFYENRGDGTFEPPIRYGLNKNAFAPFYADFTGDGVADLAAVVGLPPSGLFGAVTIVRGNGTAPAGLALPSGESTFLRLPPPSPNPFSRWTRLRYFVQADGTARLGIFDLAGRRIRSLLQATGHPGAGEIWWDGRDDLGRPVRSGIYLIRLQVGDSMATQKVSLIR